MAFQNSFLFICECFMFSGQIINDLNGIMVQGVLALCYFWDLEKSRISQKSHQENDRINQINKACPSILKHSQIFKKVIEKFHFGFSKR